MQKVFKCTLVGAGGSQIETVRRAPSLPALEAKVANDGFRVAYSKIDWLMTLKEIDPSVKEPVLVDFLDFLADEVGAGTTPTKICRLYAKGKKKKVAAVFNKVAIRIEHHHMSLADALHAERVTLDEGLLGVIKEGEKGGELFADTLGRLAKSRVEVQRIKGMMMKGIFLPSITILISIFSSLGTAVDFTNKNQARIESGRLHSNVLTDLVMWYADNFLVFVGGVGIVIALIFGGYSYLAQEKPAIVVRFWIKYKRLLSPIYNIIITKPLLDFSMHLMASRNLGVTDAQMLRGISSQTQGIFGFIFLRAAQKIKSTHLGRAFANEVMIPDFFRNRLNTIGTVEDRDVVKGIVEKLSFRMLELREKAIMAFSRVYMAFATVFALSLVVMLIGGTLLPIYSGASDALNNAMRM